MPAWIAGKTAAPPNAGSKRIPKGAPDCLNKLAFVITGLHDSLTKEQLTDLIKSHGG